MDKKTREMAKGMIQDMVREEAGLLRMEMQPLDHVMDHLERDRKAIEKRLGREDGKRG